MKTLDRVITIMLTVVCVPLSLWGGSRHWGGPTDLLPVLLIGLAILYLTFEGTRVSSAGLAAGLGVLIGVAQFVPSLFLYQRDAGGLMVLIVGYAVYGLIVYGVANAIRRARKEEQAQEELGELKRQRQILEEKKAILDLEATLDEPSGTAPPGSGEELGQRDSEQGTRERQDSADPEPEFLRTVEDGNKTYELYEGDDPERAKTFLLGRSVDKPLFYVQVRTSAGVWGMDIEGLFLTDLLEWQTDLSLAKDDGEVVGVPAMLNLGFAARGIADNFVVEVRCGNCRHEWYDGLRYQNDTAVRCPACGEYQRVDSRHLRYIEPGV